PCTWLIQVRMTLSRHRRWPLRRKGGPSPRGPRPDMIGVLVRPAVCCPGWVRVTPGGDSDAPGTSAARPLPRHRSGLGRLRAGRVASVREPEPVRVPALHGGLVVRHRLRSPGAEPAVTPLACDPALREPAGVPEVAGASRVTHG